MTTPRVPRHVDHGLPAQTLSRAHDLTGVREPPRYACTVSDTGMCNPRSTRPRLPACPRCGLCRALADCAIVTCATCQDGKHRTRGVPVLRTEDSVRSRVAWMNCAPRIFDGPDRNQIRPECPGCGGPEQCGREYVAEVTGNPRDRSSCGCLAWSKPRPHDTTWVPPACYRAYRTRCTSLVEYHVGRPWDADPRVCRS